MNLAAISLDLIRLKQPLPFSLRGPDGKLLAKKGFVVGSMESLQMVAGGRGELYIDVDESDNYRRCGGPFRKKTAKNTLLMRCGRH